MITERTTAGVLCKRMFDNLHGPGYWSKLKPDQRERARRALCDAEKSAFSTSERMIQMVEACCESMRISPEAVKSSCRSATIAMARRAIVFAMRNSTPQPSWNEIGRALRKTNHSTVWHLYEQCVNEMNRGNQAQQQATAKCAVAIAGVLEELAA